MTNIETLDFSYTFNEKKICAIRVLPAIEGHGICIYFESQKKTILFNNEEERNSFFSDLSSKVNGTLIGNPPILIVKEKCNTISYFKNPSSDEFHVFIDFGNEQIIERFESVGEIEFFSQLVMNE